jgi:hypothetical protein
VTEVYESDEATNDQAVVQVIAQAIHAEPVKVSV